MKHLIKFIELFYRTYKYSFYCKRINYHSDQSFKHIKNGDRLKKWRKHIAKTAKFNAKCLKEQQKIEVLQNYFKENFKGLDLN